MSSQHRTFHIRPSWRSSPLRTKSGRPWPRRRPRRRALPSCRRCTSRRLWRQAACTWYDCRKLATCTHLCHRWHRRTRRQANPPHPAAAAAVVARTARMLEGSASLKGCHLPCPLRTAWALLLWMGLCTSVWKQTRGLATAGASSPGMYPWVLRLSIDVTTS